MNLKQIGALVRSPRMLLIAITLLTGVVFKASAFAREAFIAARFGLSAVTDTYFGLQQLPITLATFMFGSFVLAFAPAYSAAWSGSERRDTGRISWMPGLLIYGTAVGVILTIAMLAASPALLQIFSRTSQKGTFETLAILSFCFAPIVWIGIWAGVCTARGSNLWAMSMTGLPYLVMTLALLGIYFAGGLSNLSLPISMTIGFLLIGIFGLVQTLRSGVTLDWKAALKPWRIAEFRAFLGQLAASSVENGGFASNQLLMLYFLAKSGEGAVSANNCAMRIGMLGYSMLAQPILQLVHSQFCSTTGAERAAAFRKWMGTTAAVVGFAAVLMLALRYPMIRIVYMRGNFTVANLNAVASILPAWIGYFVVMTLNGIVARYLFTNGQGTIYVRRMLMAYGAANAARFITSGHSSAASVVWYSVIFEAIALAFGIRSCLVSSAAAVPMYATAETQVAS